MTPGAIDKIEQMKRLERCFMTPIGEIDLKEMSDRLSEPVFREYCEAAREWRAQRRKKSLNG